MYAHNLFLSADSDPPSSRCRWGYSCASFSPPGVSLRSRATLSPPSDTIPAILLHGRSRARFVLALGKVYLIKSCSAGNVVVVVVIVCMGLLITVLSVGVVRLRAAHNRSHQDEVEVEMAWDGAPNITVNPLEVPRQLLNLSCNLQY